jgi:hypothetical protein
MKYIKHMSDSSDDDFIVELEATFGLEGYARWWKLLEAIAAQMKTSEDYTLAYPWSKWQTILKGKRKKLETFLEHCQKKQKIFLKHSQNIPETNEESPGNILEISCPKLKEIKDNYTRDLEASSKQLPRLKEEEKGKEERTRRLSFSDADMETAVFILGKIQNIRPEFKEPNLEVWASDVRLIRERDGHDHRSIQTLFSWVNNDNFWKSNILSPGKLRSKWDQLEIQRSSSGNGYRSQAEINSASQGRVVV